MTEERTEQVSTYVTPDTKAQLKNEHDKVTIRQDVHEAIEKAEGKGSNEPAGTESTEESSGNNAVTPHGASAPVR